jgi:Ran GTPase-activating protein (RanGAP) involved in mRNA processing and transport
MFSIYIYPTQALIMLDLYLNEIGAEGARHLADALKINTVRSFFYPFITSASFSFKIQALTTLNLVDNNIGNQGAQYLANALEINRVRVLFDWINEIFTIFIKITDTYRAESDQKPNWQ